MQHNILYVTCNNQTKTSNLINNERKIHKSSLREDLVLDKSYATFTYTETGVLFQPSEKFKIELNEKRQKAVAEFKYEAKSLTSNASYYVLNDYANLGWSMATGDLNNDQNDDLIVGAPVYSLQNAFQNGQVFITYAKNGALPMTNVNLEAKADFIINPPDLTTNSSKFGHSIVVLDLNQDGYNDIAISAPSYNLGKIKYQV